MSKISLLDIDRYIILAKENNQRAFTVLLDYYWNMVYNFQIQKGNSDDDAEDICIETFSRTFDKIKTYNAELSFKNWLLTISKNIHIDRVRKNKKDILSEARVPKNQNNAQDEESSIEDKIIREQQLDILLKNIEKLNPPYRKIIQLRYFQEMSHAQIAEVLDESLSNIKIKLYRARKLLSHLIR